MTGTNWKGAGTALGITLAGLVATGCSGGGGGGGGVGNAAISQILPALDADLRAGSSTLSAGITNGTVDNPNEVEPNSSATRDLTSGGEANNGDAVVDVAVSDSRQANGSGTLQVTISENGGAHVFLDATLDYGAPKISFRKAPLGYADLAADGTGRAFFIARLEQNATLTRTLANTSADTARTLFSGVTVSDGAEVMDVHTIWERLVEVTITLTAGGDLQARIEETRRLNTWREQERRGGPAVAALDLDFSLLTFGSQSFDGNRDVSVPLGTDADPASLIAAGAAVSLQANVLGGVTGRGLDTDVDGDITTNTSTGSSVVSHSTTLDTINDIGDGVVQVDASVDIDSKSEEEPFGGTWDHLLDGDLDPYADLATLLVLPSKTSVERRLRLFH